jgi:hypothetical protein
VGLEFADVIARLYTVPPDEFIAEREEAVERAKAAGDRKLAVQIGKLRKPSLAAWLVNLLAHQRPHLIGELMALGDELRDAQRELRGAQLRELSMRRLSTVVALVRQARELAVAAGRPVPEKLPLAEVEQTLTAALADKYLANEVRAGRLTKRLDYAGFGEAPRPQLRLVQGGGGAGVEPETEPFATPQTEPEPSATPQTEPEPFATPQTELEPSATPQTELEPSATPKKAKAKPTAEEVRARQERRAEQARQGAERKSAAERARAMKVARRELLAASLQMIDAQAAREAAQKALATAERAIAAAQQRADEAKATLDKLTRRD